MITKFPKRRVVKMGYSRMVSLPKVWLSSVCLKSGDQVEMEMAEDGSLVIRPSRGECDDKTIQ